MASRKVAPNLENVLADAERRHPMFTSAARAELRALLAVARAAKPGHECGAGAKPKRCALCRALARLSRAGRAKGERNG